jgi:hypothetical protein
VVGRGKRKHVLPLIGRPATPDLERRQHQTAETVYFGRTTGYLLNNDPKKSIKGTYGFYGEETIPLPFFLMEHSLKYHSQEK